MISPVLWCDPGKSTGLALWNGQREQIGEYGFRQAAFNIAWACEHFGPRLRVGWERFTIKPDTHKKSADAHHAIEMIGVCRYLAGLHGAQVLTAAAPGDRNVATPAKLRKLGWWVPGKDDAQSAAQHLAAWMLRSGEIPPELREVVTST